MSFAESTDSTSEKPVSILWGCELSRQKDSYTFQMPEEWHCEQQLALRTVCLGESVPDEFHVVEMVAEEGDAQTRVLLATLKPSVLPMTTLVGVELTPPITFHLRAGTGPVYITGQHITMLSSDEEEESEEEEEESPQKPPKGQNSRNTGGAAKKRRLEKEYERKSAIPEKPLPAKGRGAGRGRKAAPKK
ncbi:nucleoplasmin-2 isoform X2 [Myiozetetes cayanensis]|uniref:nucleoplasmin-2 isoform X2 n=1 Tax=Myiozetetes cayanensis TaxID=478635 RepID=UPI0021603854|nr:nucleoplasmin-2 isoform X2 [Myiozetetes cayanensis]